MQVWGLFQLASFKRPVARDLSGTALSAPRSPPFFRHPNDPCHVAVICHGLAILAKNYNRAYTACVTKLEYDTKISDGGRMVIPAEVRKALGLVAGDRVRLVFDEGEVHLVSARTMAVGLWANNHGGDAGDSVVDVREFRLGDRALSDARHEAHKPDPRSEEQIAEDVMSALGLNA